MILAVHLFQMCELASLLLLSILFSVMGVRRPFEDKVGVLEFNRWDARNFKFLYPERWDQSGIITFIVNQDGKVFQRNLGEKTSRDAAAMKEYNPDSGWALVPDERVLGAVAEK